MSDSLGRLARRSVLAAWLFLATAAAGETVEELKAKLAQAEIDKAVLAERSRFSVGQVIIALIGALPALYAAYLTFLGNRMVKSASDVTHTIAAAIPAPEDKKP